MTFDLRQSIDPNRRRVRVNIESPLRGHVEPWVPELLKPMVERARRLANRVYARRCVRDSLKRGEAPYASHVFFDQPGILDDANPHERLLGMQCGDAWAMCADRHVFYCDRGMSPGMQRRWKQCAEEGRLVERRYIFAPHKNEVANDNAA